MSKKRFLSFVFLVILGLFSLKNINFSSSLESNVYSILEKNILSVGGEKEDEENLIKEDLFLVSRVIDGDTIEILINNEKEKVRLIGVDTPESVHPTKKVECFGKEASIYLKNILEGRYIKLEYDFGQGDRDKYKRLLRYVYLEDILINKKIIEDGFGYEYTYNIPYKFQTDFKIAENLAKSEGRGLWAENICN